MKNLNVYCSLPLETAGPSVHTGQASGGRTTDVTTQSGWETSLRNYVAILPVGQAVLSWNGQVCICRKWYFQHYSCSLVLFWQKYVSIFVLVELTLITAFLLIFDLKLSERFRSTFRNVSIVEMCQIPNFQERFLHVPNRRGYPKRWLSTEQRICYWLRWRTTRSKQMLLVSAQNLLSSSSITLHQSFFSSKSSMTSSTLREECVWHSVFQNITIVNFVNLIAIMLDY